MQNKKEKKKKKEISMPDRWLNDEQQRKKTRYKEKMKTYHT